MIIVKIASRILFKCVENDPYFFRQKIKKSLRIWGLRSHRFDGWGPRPRSPSRIYTSFFIPSYLMVKVVLFSDKNAVQIFLPESCSQRCILKSTRWIRKWRTSSNCNCNYILFTTLFRLGVQQRNLSVFESSCHLLPSAYHIRWSFTQSLLIASQAGKL